MPSDRDTDHGSHARKRMVMRTWNDAERADVIAP